MQDKTAVGRSARKRGGIAATRSKPMPPAAVPALHPIESAPIATIAGAGDGPTAISADERRVMIAQAAYLRAASRGFAGGSAEQDWLDAEAEIDRSLKGSA